MNISQLRRIAQESPNLTAQAYLQVEGVLYPIADIVVERDSFVIVPGDALVDEDESLDQFENAPAGEPTNEELEAASEEQTAETADASGDLEGASGTTDKVDTD